MITVCCSVLIIIFLNKTLLVFLIYEELTLVSNHEDGELHLTKSIANELANVEEALEDTFQTIYFHNIFDYMFS